MLLKSLTMIIIVFALNFTSELIAKNCVKHCSICAYPLAETCLQTGIDLTCEGRCDKNIKRKIPVKIIEDNLQNIPDQFVGTFPEGNVIIKGGKLILLYLDHNPRTVRSVTAANSALDYPEQTPLPDNLYPVRDFIEPNEIPPKNVGAYGMVAFTQKPTSSTRQRFTFICENFLSTLLLRKLIPSSIPIDQLMVTYWPVEKKNPSKINEGNCDYLIDKYDLFSGLEAVRDADLKRERLAERRGPFLIGWSPAKSRYEKDAVVLIVDLSGFESEESFREAFQRWRTDITDKPELWRNGFSIGQIRLTLRDFLDRYGESILKAITPG